MAFIKEDYVDNVPDMAGPSPFKSDGTRKDDFAMIRIPATEPGKKDRWARVQINFWETPKQHIKSAYVYYMIKTEDGDVVYVKAPTTMDKIKLNEKIDQFLRDEYGYTGIWEMAGRIFKDVAKKKSEWRP